MDSLDELLKIEKLGSNEWKIWKSCVNASNDPKFENQNKK